MAQQRRSQRTRQPQLPTRDRSKGTVRRRADPSSTDDLRRECDRLRTELESARAEIDELRKKQAKVLDRIDWVLDSLRSLPGIET